MSFFRKVTTAIKELNAIYGRGDVRAVMLYADGTIKVVRVPMHCKSEVRRGRLVNDRTVMFLGRQRTLDEKRASPQVGQ